MYIKRDLYLTKTPFKITYEFKWLPIQGIYCVQTGSCSNYDGKFKSVGCNKFTLFPILGVERSFPWLQLGKVSAILGKLQLGKVSVILGKERILSWKGKDPFLSQERSSLQLGKVSVILGNDPFLSQERSSLQLGKVSAIFRKVRKGKGKESIQTLP